MNNLKRLIDYGKKIINNPYHIFKTISSRGGFRWLSDKLHLKLMYYVNFRKRLNLENPSTFTEKIQWLKLYDRNPLYTKLVDKYEVRKYIKSKIGEKYLIPLLGVWNNIDDVEWENLPEKFVLKTTHDSGGVVVCHSKEKLNFESAKKKLQASLNTNYYYSSKEWPYKNVPKRIIAEQYMYDEKQNGLNDFKVYCFNGEPKVMLIASNRNVDVRYDYFDLKFNHLPISLKNSKEKIEKPIKFEKMIELSRILSKDFPHIRVDFYEINGEIYFGELTFYSDSGFGYWGENHDEYDKLFGNWLTLPPKKINN